MIASTTATCGRSVVEKASWNDDTSATSTSVASATASINGRPMFPAVSARTPEAMSMAAVSDVTVVFPFVPVTPTIGTRARSAARSISLRTGTLSARAAIVTVSTNVLTSGKIKFDPDLPKRHLDAAAKLKLGSYDHIALELPDNPLALRADELVFEKSDSAHTAALFANVSGTPLSIVDVAGTFGRDLAAKGEDAMFDFAQSWLTGLFGVEIGKTVRRKYATRWNEEPWVLGAFSAAAPGAQGARRVLMEPVGERIWFAGEAAHETLWGTVGGAWESGERAADAAIKRIRRG